MKGNVIEDGEMSDLTPTDVNISSQVDVINETSLDTIAVPKNKCIRELPTRNSLRKNKGTIVQRCIPVSCTRKVFRTLSVDMWTTYSTIPMGEK